MASRRESGGLSLFPSESGHHRKPSLRKKRSKSPLPPTDPPVEHAMNPSGKRDMHTTVIQVRSESPSGLYQYPVVPKRTSTPVTLAPLPSPKIRGPPSPHLGGGPEQANGYNSRPVSGLYDMASPVGNIPLARATSPSPTDTNASSHMAHSSPATSHSATPPMAFTKVPPAPLPKPPPASTGPAVPFSANQAQQRIPRPPAHHNQTQTQPPSPPPTGPAPVPITSIFPTYDPNISLMEQNYAPAYNPLASATSPTSTADDPTSPLSALSSSPPQTTLPLHALSRPAYSSEIARACSPPPLGGFVSHDPNPATTPNKGTAPGPTPTDKATPKAQHPKPSPRREKPDALSSSSAAAAEDPRLGPQFPPPPTKEVKPSWREQRERRQREERARQAQEREWARERKAEKDKRREQSRETGKLAKGDRSVDASRTRALADKGGSSHGSGVATAARTNRWDDEDEKRNMATGRGRGRGAAQAEDEDEGGFARFVRALKRLFGIESRKRKSRAMARGPNSSGWL